MKQNIEAVIFDADGTLLDSRELVFQAYEHVLTEHGYQMPDRIELAKHMGSTTDYNYSVFAPESDTDRLVALHREFQVQRPDLLAMYEGLHPFLEALRAAGLKLGMCTSRGNNVLALLEHAGVGKYLDSIVHAEMVLKHKPDPEGLLKVFEELKVEASNAVMIGDTEADIGAGKAACVAFTIGLTHGFGTRQSLEEAGADYIVDRLDEIIPLVVT